MGILEFAPVFIIAFMLGAVTVLCIWRFDLIEQEKLQIKQMLEMKARMKPFQELAKEYARAKDDEGYQNCMADIYRIMSEYAPNF